ncbi:MAG: flagellar basal body protein, partial [Myxococcota bacterium]|nr:flagellar basal body protein [Myxococcota bacterium]
MSILDVLNTAHTGIKAASAGIEVTGQNVTNVNTEGYHKRTLRTGVRNPLVRGGQSVGQGVTRLGIARAMDKHVGNRLVA